MLRLQTKWISDTISTVVQCDLESLRLPSSQFFSSIFHLRWPADFLLPSEPQFMLGGSSNMRLWFLTRRHSNQKLGKRTCDCLKVIQLQADYRKGPTSLCFVRDNSRGKWNFEPILLLAPSKNHKIEELVFNRRVKIERFPFAKCVKGKLGLFIDFLACENTQISTSRVIYIVIIRNLWHGSQFQNPKTSFHIVYSALLFTG